MQRLPGQPVRAARVVQRPDQQRHPRDGRNGICRECVAAKERAQQAIDRASAASGTTDLDTTVAALWRVESPRVIARLARLVGDVGTAEELAQDAFATAIEKWRSEGVPNNPAGWLHKTARFLAVDLIRRRDTQHGKYQQIAATTSETTDVDIDEVVRVAADRERERSRQREPRSPAAPLH